MWRRPRKRSLGSEMGLRHFKHLNMECPSHKRLEEDTIKKTVQDWKFVSAGEHGGAKDGGALILCFLVGLRVKCRSRPCFQQPFHFLAVVAFTGLQ